MEPTTTSSDEKLQENAASLPSLKALNVSSESVDKALVYVQETAAEELSDEEAGSLLRRIDWRIVPLAALAYMLQFLDKLDVNFAAVMGFNQNLHLVGNNFNDAASAMYIASLVAELPTAYITQKLPPGKWLSVNIMLWGLVTAASAAVKNYHALLATRILVGIFEAATPPCLMLITSMWYTKEEAIRRFGVWYIGLGLAQMFGSLLSWGFLQVTHDAIQGWRIMFIFLGLFTMVLGGWMAYAMPDSPMQAYWLTPSEKRKAIQRVAVNQTGIKNTHFKVAHLWELLFDVQMWLIVAMTALLSMSSGVVSFYSTTLIHNFGFTPKKSALLNMPSGAVSFLTTLFVAGFVKTRTTWIPILALAAAMGSALMSFLPSHNKAGLLAGLYLVNVATADLILFFSLTTANIAGQTKRAAANALVTAAFSVGNIAGPQLFKPKDAPQYIPAKIVLLVTQGTTAGLAIILRLYYIWQNKKRDEQEKRERESGEWKEIPNVEWLNLTDKENKTFRYKY